MRGQTHLIRERQGAGRYLLPQGRWWQTPPPRWKEAHRDRRSGEDSEELGDQAAPAGKYKLRGRMRRSSRQGRTVPAHSRQWSGGTGSRAPDGGAPPLRRGWRSPSSRRNDRRKRDATVRSRDQGASSPGVKKSRSAGLGMSTGRRPVRFSARSAMVGLTAKAASTAG